MAHQQSTSHVGGFRCASCGQYHDSLPLAYGPPAPELYYRLPEAERASRCELSLDACVIDEKHCFIVGNLEIPIVDSPEIFRWDVWVSLSFENFTRMCTLWETEGRESEPPYFGWLSTQLPTYPETLSLKTYVHTRKVGQRPSIQLEATDHPLAVEQRTGITMDRVREIAEAVLHGA